MECVAVSGQDASAPRAAAAHNVSARRRDRSLASRAALFQSVSVPVPGRTRELLVSPPVRSTHGGATRHPRRWAQGGGARRPPCGCALVRCGCRAAPSCAAGRAGDSRPTPETSVKSENMSAFRPSRSTRPLSRVVTDSPVDGLRSSVRSPCTRFTHHTITRFRCDPADVRLPRGVGNAGGWPGADANGSLDGT